MARTRDEKAFAAKQKEILRAAESLFVKQGFHQTGMAAICEAAGMSPGALYRYFDSKADIIQAFVEEEQAETAEMFEDLATTTNFKKSLVEILVVMIDAVSDETYGQLALEIAAEGARDDKIGPILARAEQDALDQLTGVIIEAQKAGKIDEEADAQVSARVLLMIINGATGSSLGVTGLSKRKLRGVLTRVVDGMFSSSH